jgi:hypothetical protein
MQEWLIEWNKGEENASLTIYHIGVSVAKYESDRYDCLEAECPAGNLMEDACLHSAVVCYNRWSSSHLYGRFHCP